MESRRLHSIGALFETPDQIIKAARETVKAGFKHFDVNTPYPVHGMDDAMSLKASKIGWVTLAFGLLGLTVATVFQWWSSAVDYPLVIGGKPFWSHPAFVPVKFEVTVLFGALSTVAAMLFIFGKLPRNNHPIQETNYLRRCSSDRYGVCIEARDPNFDPEKVKSFLQNIGGKDVSPVYYDDSYGMSPGAVLKFLGGLLLIATITTASTYFLFNRVLTDMVPFSWMASQAKTNPQKQAVFYKPESGMTKSPITLDGYRMRRPVEGTVARGYIPYAFAGQPDEAGKYLSNPLEGTADVLERGQERYNTFCSPCHGYFGDGDSRLREQFPNPPSLHSSKVRSEWSDGRIYAVIEEGQNVMPSYAKQISREDRWAITHYVRALQRAKNAKDSDLE